MKKDFGETVYSSKMDSEYMMKYYPFSGCNEEFEIESFGEFQHKTQGKKPEHLNLKGYVVREIPNRCTMRSLRILCWATFQASVERIVYHNKLPPILQVLSHNYRPQHFSPMPKF